MESNAGDLTAEELKKINISKIRAMGNKSLRLCVCAFAHVCALRFEAQLL